MRYSGQIVFVVMQNLNSAPVGGKCNGYDVPVPPVGAAAWPRDSHPEEERGRRKDQVYSNS